MTTYRKMLVSLLKLKKFDMTFRLKNHTQLRVNQKRKIIKYIQKLRAHFRYFGEKIIRVCVKVSDFLKEPHINSI
jgi:hypothetical protein